jgi:tol-pal system protein YbgF
VGCGTTNNELLLNQVKDLNHQLTEMRKSQAGVTVTVEDLETRLFLVQDELDTYRKRSRNIAQLPVVRVEPQHGPDTFFNPNADTKNDLNPMQSGPLFFDRFDDEGNLIRGGTANAPPAPAPQVRPAPPLTPIRGRLNKKQHAAVDRYKISYDLYKKQKYQDALEGFRAFVEQNPTHGYADNAIYWMGECFYDRGLWLQALKTFQQVIQNYPLGNKAPDAMLKVALSHQQLKNYAEARRVLKQVTQIYPDSPIARLAESRLQKLP